VREVLQSVRKKMRSAAPGVEARISHRLLAHFIHGALLYFAAFKQAVGLYPARATRRCRLIGCAMPARRMTRGSPCPGQ